MCAAYAPPSHPPPTMAASSSASPPPPPPPLSNSGYAPTQTPTPGQPLLRNGKMLVYPHGWQGCPKCQDTGYKQGDPTHPCRTCWQDYGKPFNPLLISAAGLQGAKVLQRPLPAWQAPGGRGPMPPGRLQSQAPTGYAGYPGAAGPMSPQSPGASHNPFLSHQHTGASYAAPFAPQSTGGSFAPPTGAPPPNLPPRRADPPRVNRTEDSREDDINEDGEAPPAYEVAVAAGPDGAVPPQRAEEHRATSATQPHASSVASPPTPAHQQYAPPMHMHPPPQQQHYAPHNQQHAAGPHGPWHGGMGYGGGPVPHIVPYGHVPPPHALVVRPGDPRIGGRLCHKCGGDGVREDFWFGGTETCRTCNGSGRIM